MKRIAVLLLSLLLTLAGCAAAPAQQPAASQPEMPAAAEPEAAETPEPPQEEAAQPEESDGAEAQEEQPREEPVQGSEETAGEAQVAIVDTGVTYTHEDGAELAAIQSQEITVTIPGKPEVEENINADLRNLLEESDQSNQMLVSAAKEDYSLALEDGLEWSPYQSSLKAAVTRCDSRVLSLRFTAFEYTGGVHGYASSYGRSYDLASGSRLTLDFMSAQGASFREAALEQIQALCQTEEYQDLLFAPEIYADALSDVVRDDSFCLDGEGVVFLADPYLIGPYASGIIEFPLPYEELTGVLKSGYLPEGD